MAPVVLNVYDLTQQNHYWYYLGVGVFHTGVEVYGIEYAYGGHDYDVSGVFATNPREAPGAVHFRESIHMGDTDKTPAQVQQLVQQMGQLFKGNSYHLLQKNCNHFASDLCKQLTGTEPPPWINRLAGIAVMLHCLLPSAWVPPLETPSIMPDVAAPVAAAAASSSSSGRKQRMSRCSSRRQQAAAAALAANANGNGNGNNSSSSSSDPQLKSRGVVRSNSRTRLLSDYAAAPEGTQI